MVTFGVDEVEEATERLPTIALGEKFAAALVVGGDPATRVLRIEGTHPLLAAVSLAFAEHRALVLSPDAIWLTITQGVAQHVRLNKDKLRSLLVRHDGKKTLAVEVQSMPATAAEWAHWIGEYRQLLAAEIGDGPARLFECNFSTSTDTERLASQIVLLDAYSPYFDLEMTCICGIPRITLTGTPADWRRIRDRIDVIAELDLETWCRSLRPICDAFVAASEGNADRAFWKRIYNPEDAYGGDLITGWITRFYPYLSQQGAHDKPNPMLDLRIGEPSNLGRKLKSMVGFAIPGIRSSQVPDVLSRAEVRIEERTTSSEPATLLGNVALVAGVAAIAQDDDGALRPIASWHIEMSETQIDAVLERIVGEPGVTKPSLRRPANRGPKDVVALYRQIEHARLFEGERTWWLRPLEDHDHVEHPDRDVHRTMGRSAGRLIDLPDGKSLCFSLSHDDRIRWFVCEIERREPGGFGPSPRATSFPIGTPADWPVLGSSLAAILGAALDTRGEWEQLVVGDASQVMRIGAW